MTDLGDNPTKAQMLAALTALRESIDQQRSAMDLLFALFNSEAEASPSPIPARTELTVTDVARRLRKSRSWVYERMDSGDLPYSQVSARRRVVRAQDLEAFLISRRS